MGERGDRGRPAGRRRHRVGVVLLVPPPFDRDVDALRRSVGDRTLGRIPPHLTLVPPVNVPAAALGDVLAGLRQAASAAAPIDVTLGPPATFLPANPVLYLAVGGAGAGAIGALRAAVARGPLDRPAPWPFVPHVTLADAAAPERLAAATVALAGFEVAVSFRSVHLLEEGADRVWRPAAEMALRPAPVVGRGGLEVELAVADHLDVEASAWAAGEWARHHTAGSGRRELAVTARRRGTVVGVARGWTRGRLATLSDLVVAEAVRGEGIGSHLLAAFTSAAADRGATRCRVRVDAGSRAEGFHRRRGWREEARYPGPTAAVDVVQLARSL